MRTPSRPTTGAADAGREERGNAIVIGLIVMVGLAGLALAFMQTGVRASREHASAKSGMRVLYVAEAGISHALADLGSGGDGNLGQKDAQVPFGGGSYWVVCVDHGNGSYTVTSYAKLGGRHRAIEAVLAPEVRTLFAKALFGDLKLEGTGSVFTDSYDTDGGTYASQATHVDPVTGAVYALPHGHLGSNGNIEINGSVTILGDATPGPGHTVLLTGGSAYVKGSTKPAAAAEPLPPVKYEPPVSSAGALQAKSPGTQTLSSGTYHYDSLSLGSKAVLLIEGDVTLYVDGDFQVTGQGQIVLDRGASLTIYHGGSDLALTGKGLLNQDGLPGSFKLFSTADTVKFAGTSGFFGAIYAPNAVVEPTGTTDIFGSFVGKQIRITGNANFHYDEALSRSEDSVTALRRVSWRRVTYPGD